MKNKTITTFLEDDTRAGYHLKRLQDSMVDLQSGAVREEVEEE